MLELNTKANTGPIFSLIYMSFHDVFKHPKAKYKSHFVQKVFRTALIGGSIWNQTVVEKINGRKDDAVLELFAALYESFLFYARSLYDASIDIIELSSEIQISKSYNELIKKLKEGKYPKISGKFRKELLSTSDVFFELKDVRDSIKRNTSVEVIRKEGSLFIKMRYKNQKKNKYVETEEKLSLAMVKHATFIALLAINIRKHLDER